MNFPNKGGSYTREKDGSLRQVTEATKPIEPAVSDTPVAESSLPQKEVAKPAPQYSEV